MTRLRWLVGLTMGLGLATSAVAVGPVLNHCLFSFNMGPAPDGNLTAFHVKIGPTPGGPYPFVWTVPATSPLGNLTVTTPNLCASLLAGQQYAVVAAVDLTGAESPPSQVVPFTFTPVPDQVTGLTVTLAP